MGGRVDGWEGGEERHTAGLPLVHATPQVEAVVAVVAGKRAHRTRMGSHGSAQTQRTGSP